MNVGTTPTFVTRAREEVLDATIASVTARKNVTGWKVMNEPSLSDYRIIEFIITGELTSSLPSRNPRKTSWSVYKVHLKDNLEQIEYDGAKHPHYDLKQNVEQISTAIIEAFHSSSRLSKVRASKEARRLNENLSTLIVEVHRLFNKAKRDDHFYPNSSQITKSHGKGGKQSYFVPQKARYVIHGGRRGSVLLLKTHFQGSEPIMNADIATQTKNPRKEDWDIVKKILTRQRLEWAINTFRPHKSPGVDGIFPVLLQKGMEEIIPHLLNSIKSSLALGQIPKI
ncbi:uncharacterized protein LOC123673260 [Harmonia axyridis]|uniref:uncharacterized protein LOC123673260 n=1 Tax=Harmonia axyridis TaxID=115357 RepID=UPI001E275358|nr:uncharacterized protein LOC123673260 [Harmonia axyridis]